MQAIPLRTTRRERWWIASASLVFVAAWLIGLLVQFGAPEPAASRAEVLAYYLAHQQSQMLSSFLVHGIAGAALLVFAAALKSVLREFSSEGRTLADVVFGAGVAAAGLSFVQAACGVVLAHPGTLAGTDSGVAWVLFDLINTTDTFKLLALALLIGAPSIFALRTSVLPRWLGSVGVLLSPLLVVGGLSFVLNSTILYSTLYFSLPLLLLWVGAVGVAHLWRVDGTPEKPGGELRSHHRVEQEISY